MASQAALISETIAGMKKAVKRKAYDSDSDSSIEQLTNRGNKLRKKARYIHEGQLAPPSGPQVYKRKIEHAGFHREIISRNPPLVDEDGYDVDSDDDDERAQAAIAAAAEFDPYADVRIEHLLAPLTAASDLPDHPTLSKPFTSKTLTELTRHAGEMVQKEKESLWRIKHLLTRLTGDNTWIPCESVETENDFHLFIDERDRNAGNILQKVMSRDEGDQVSTGTLASEEDVVMILSADSTGAAEKRQAEELVEALKSKGNEVLREPVPGSIAGEPPAEGSMEVDRAQETAPDDVNEDQAQLIEIDGEEGDEEDPAPHRMRTRAQAQAASDNTVASRTRSITPDSSNDTKVDPYFLAPLSAHADRNVGLPQHEAEETRRLLQLYIQKQEEVCRGAQRVYEGLLKADRYRKLVMKWAKAEGHVGLNRDMSDGEDWYDKEEWGLEEDLKKGQDEEEEDAATTAKKTRARRQ
ncbi:RXT2-like protein [Hyaloscypha finlandica]|nr:RXT2-like protein [Hyaloscypha finlandica]